MSGRNIRLVIEYSDYAVGRTLQVCVQDWIKHLPTRKMPKIFSIFKDQWELGVLGVPYLFASASLFGFSRVTLKNSLDIGPHILSSLSFVILMFLAGRFLGQQFFQQLNLSKPLTFMLITNGDKLRREKMIKTRAKKVALSIFFAGTILTGIAVNLWSSYIWEAIN